MRSRTGEFFLCKVRYEKVTEDGLQKKVTEQFVVDAISFTEAEARIIEEVSSCVSGDFDIAEIDRCVFKEIFFSDEENADKWYKAKLQFITIDDESGKEKKTSVYYLVQAGSFDAARKNIDKVLGDSMMDYRVVAVKETNILDVYEYSSHSTNA